MNEPRASASIPRRDVPLADLAFVACAVVSRASHSGYARARSHFCCLIPWPAALRRFLGEGGEAYAAFLRTFFFF